MSNRVAACLVGIWALTVMGALFASSLNQISLFDPNMALAQAAAKSKFDSEFSAHLQAAGVKPGSIVHLQSSQRCFCNTLAEPHKDELLSALSDEGYGFAKVSLDNQPQIKQYITQFPAIAVMDKAGSLRYLGPYATGYGCLSGVDLVDEISRLATTENYFGAQINSEAKGCFCSA